jgi:hypothetical protein
MEYALGSRHGCGHGDRVRNIGFDDTQTRISIVLLEVSAPADDQIIEHANRAPLRQKAIHQVTTDKSGAARHQIDSNRHCHEAAPPAHTRALLMRAKIINFKRRKMLRNDRPRPFG